jgi:hypothetical protein
MAFMRAKTAILLAFFSTVLLAGCGDSGPELGEVYGRGSVGGQPEADLIVMFEPRDGEGRDSFGMTNQDGEYEVGYAGERMGALVGPHTVRISRQTMDENDEPLPDVVPLPERYNANSDLTREVESGTNEFSFELESQ